MLINAAIIGNPPPPPPQKKLLYCEVLLQFKITVFYLNIFLNVIYYCDGKAEISTSLLQSPVSHDPLELFLLLLLLKFLIIIIVNIRRKIVNCA